MTGFWGSIQGDILFNKNSNARFRVITGTNAKKFAQKYCQERPIWPWQAQESDFQKLVQFHFLSESKPKITILYYRIWLIWQRKSGPVDHIAWRNRILCVSSLASGKWSFLLVFLARINEAFYWTFGKCAKSALETQKRLWLCIFA